MVVPALSIRANAVSTSAALLARTRFIFKTQLDRGMLRLLELHCVERMSWVPQDRDP